MAAVQSRWSVLAPTLLAAVIAAAYLAWGPSSEDLAAATFRADLFADHGFVLWTNAWYSGTYVLSYSVLYPPLGALLGPRLVGALAVVAAAALFAVLVRRRFTGDRALVATLWFAVAVSGWLLTGRMPFLLAVPFGLAGLLAADSGRVVLGGLAAALASLSSPVAGLFIALAGVAIALAGERLRGAALAIGGALPIAVLNLAFPLGGEEPFVFSAFIAIPILAAGVVWLVPREYRALRIGAVLYAALAIALYVVPNSLGGNVTRLGTLFAGPVVALVLWPRGRLVVIAVSVPLLYWQFVAPVRDVHKAAGDPSTEQAFYAPLLTELDRLTATEGSFRIEVPPTKNRWEAAYVARDHPIARGWLRQLESEDLDLFTGDNLTPAAYRDWLREHGVSYVAVPDARRDYLSEDEVALIGKGLDYLRPVWHDANWRLYRVVGSDAWGLDGLGVRDVEADSFEFDPAARGRTSIRWTPFWSVTAGSACVREAENGETVVEPRPGSGPVTVQAELGGDSCSG